jgi:hypothetical protein
MGARGLEPPHKVQWRSWGQLGEGVALIAVLHILVMLAMCLWRISYLMLNCGLV